MRTIQSILLLLGFAAFLGAPTPATAQMNEQEIKQLDAFSHDMARKMSSDSARLAEQAKALRIPMRLEYDNKVLILRSLSDNQPVYDGNYNLNSVISSSADDVKAGGALGLGLTGAGQTLGIWEAFEGGSNAAVRTTHQEFGGRAVQSDGAAGLSSHATHVAGTMIAAGVDPAAEGFATGADLQCYDISNDLAEMAAAAAAANPITVSNHSYGSFAGWDTDNMGNWVYYGGNNFEDWKFGAYNDQARDWDNTAFNAPFLLIVKSAGNDRNDGPGMNVNHTHSGSAAIETDNHEDDGGPDGFDCIPTYGNAKNIVTVGAANDVPGGYSGPGSVTISVFSGFGPTDDGRVKPDIVANGVSLYSSEENADDDYGFKGGTSMSAPSVAGAAGLLLEHWQNVLGGTPRANTSKGLLLHMADECGANPGPDYTFGWGMLNVADAAELITIEGYEGCQQFVTGTVNGGETFSFDLESSGTQPLKVTLTWHDPASGTVNNSTVNPAGVRYLVNDLDLRLDHNSNTFLPWVLDPANPANPATTGDNDRDNVEQVLLLSPTAGTYTIRVVAPAAVSNGPQQFTLWFSGNDAMDLDRTISSTVYIGPQTIAVRRNLRFGPAVIVGNTANVRAFAGNSIRLTPDFLAQNGSRFLARILPGGGCGQFSGELKADNYTGSVIASAMLQDRMQQQERALTESMSSNMLLSPNPSSGLVNIRLKLEQPDEIRLALIDQWGNPVKVLMAGNELQAGNHLLRFDLSGLEQGAYYCQVSGRHIREAKPLLLHRN